MKSKTIITTTTPTWQERFDEKFGRLLSNVDPDKFIFIEGEVKAFIQQLLETEIERATKETKDLFWERANVWWVSNDKTELGYEMKEELKRFVINKL